MNPSVLTILIENGLMVIVAVYITLLGYRVVGHKPGTNLTADAWFKRHGWLFRLGGPVLIVGNLFFVVYKLSK